MIRLEDVSKSYRTGAGRKVLMNHVTFTFPRGRSVALIGRNGAGKSTLLRMIGGAVAPDTGVIRCDARVSWPLGFGGAFQGSLTGAQNARFVARIYGFDTEELVSRVAEFSELGDFMYMPVRTYSSGMKARLSFAVSMAVQFDIYLIDEITAVGDAAFKRKCAETFRSKMGAADVIMVSHGSNNLRQYCDAGLVLENGRLTYYDDIEDALAVHEENMRRPYRPQ
ncbi:MAG: ABC transporter ATP-binding protein [Alphaproteobacteria bacterium]